MDNRVLAVEGNDDQHVLWNLLEIYGVRKCFAVKDLKGVENLLENLNTLIKTTSRLAIIVDADIDPQSRWNSIKNRAEELGFTLPAAPTQGGCHVKNKDGDVLGVWLMPNNIIPGMLEDFLHDIVPKDDILLPHVISFIDSLPESEHKFSDVHRMKAIIHTYLAIQENPGLPFGTAIKAKYFNSDTQEVRDLISWIDTVLVA